jgi:transcription termination factor Rho
MDDNQPTHAMTRRPRSGLKKIRLPKSQIETGNGNTNGNFSNSSPAMGLGTPPPRSEMSEQHHAKWQNPNPSDPAVAKIHINDLNKKGVEELMTVAKDLGVIFEEEVTKQKLIFQILEKSMSTRAVSIIATGVLEKMNEGFGFLRSPDFSYMPGSDDIYVSPSQLRIFGLRTGDTVTGELRPPKPQEKYFAMFQINEVNFAPVTQIKDRPSFESLTASYPTRKLSLETTQDNFGTRLIDLFSPIGLGQRAMIVSPPKAGKTMLLQNIANAITTNHPSVYLIVLLIDERPEEVTDMKRNVKAEVVSSTFDEPATRHVHVARIVLEKAKRLVEQKIDVVILLDSLTRLARAYNQVEPTSGKILTGGVDANALHKPKRFFGAARNIEEGGSLTIIATALIETGSKMDEVIFEEFKGTGNMELVLNRRIADRRIYPSIDIKKSGTRREELLLGSDELNKMFALRNALGSLDEIEAINLVLDKTRKTKNNEHFLQAMNSAS